MATTVVATTLMFKLSVGFGVCETEGVGLDNPSGLMVGVGIGVGTGVVVGIGVGVGACVGGLVGS